MKKKTTKTASKKALEAFWTARAAKIAASRAKNEKAGMTERERRAARKAAREADAAHQAAAGSSRKKAKGKTATKQLPTPKPGKLITDKSEGAYITRVTTAIERTMKGDALRFAQLIGQDAGGGWLLVVTDGWRALLQQGKSDKKTSHAITTAEPAPYGFALTPDIERALRALKSAVDKKQPTLTLDIDAKRKRLTMRGGAASTELPIAGKLMTTTLRCNLFFLLDGLGRGGRFGYTRDVLKPVSIDTADALRYVVMPIQPPKTLKPVVTKKTAATPKKTAKKTAATKTTTTTNDTTATTTTATNDTTTTQQEAQQ